MPSRHIEIDGRDWKVYPSGFLTTYIGDEFGLIFEAGEGAAREVRVTRYSPHVVQARERSLARLDRDELVALFRMSQPSDRSPEAGYRS